MVFFQSIYVLAFLGALLETYILYERKREKVNPAHLLLFIAMTISGFGYVVMSKSRDIELMCLGNDIYYIGGLLTAFFMFCVIANLCGVSVNRWLKRAIVVLDVVILGFVFNAGNNNLYYKSLSISRFHGIYVLEKERGPLYGLTVIVLVGCSLLSLGTIVYSIIKKKQVSYRTVAYLAISQLMVNVVYFLPRIHKTPIDLTVLADVVAGAIILHIFKKSEMYDMSSNLLDVYEERSGYGYMAFDNKKQYMGCSSFIRELFPEIVRQRVDSSIENPKSPMLSGILKWLEKWNASETEERIFSEGGRYVECTIRPLQHGKVKGYLVELHDDTRDQQYIKEVEIAKEEAESANASKSAFVSVVSHEIRTPMNAIVGMTDLLLRDELSDKQRRYMMNIKNSGASLVMLINDILDMSKIESGKMELVDEVYELRPMVEDVQMIIENRIGSKPVHLVVDIDEKIPRFLVGDSLRMRQIFINLMNNAVKFTESGYIQFSAQVVEEKELQSADKKIKIRFSVKDSGQGIHKEDLERLFEAFSQVDTKKNHKKEGTGLGLTISRDFISMMGGQLSVESEYGKGSEFFFTIYQGLVENEPLRSKMSVGSWKQAEFTAPEARILIVDDVEINLMITEELLKPIGMKIDTAQSGEKAVEIVQQNSYNMIFMDYMMPYMDGIKTTENIRKLAESDADNAEYYRTVPIIALSGDTSDRTHERFKMAGIDDFMEKPVEIGALKKQLIKWLPQNMIKSKDAFY